MPLYRCTIKKQFVFDVSDPFVSTYEIDSEETILTSGVAKNLIEDIALAEANVLWAGVQFISGVISTWEPDSSPYDPDNLFPKALSGTGLRAGSEDALYDQDEVYKITREPAFGKNGLIQLRGALLNSDIMFVAGEASLSPSSPLAAGNAAFTAYVAALTAAFAAALVNHSMIGQPLVNTIYPATPEGVKQVPIKVYGEPIVRSVTSLNTPRVGPKQRKNN